MSWACTDCGRTYDDPPVVCPTCRGEVIPADTAPTGRFSLSAARDRLLDPGGTDTSLVDVDPRIALAFRVLVAASVLLLLLAGVLFLLG